MTNTFDEWISATTTLTYDEWVSAREHAASFVADARHIVGNIATNYTTDAHYGCMLIDVPMGAVVANNVIREPRP